MELVRRDGESYAERQVADYIQQRLTQAGWLFEEDGAGTALGGDTGNIYAYRPGQTDPDGLLMLAHMDRVVPGRNVQVSIENGFYVSDGQTVLGADNAVGLAVMLELADFLAAQATPVGLELIFTVAEEVGIKGAKHFDVSKLVAKQGYTFDADGTIGTAIMAAPTHITFLAKVKGKAAHAGIEPERGVNAIKIASQAIATMDIGRISEDTTSNIGTVAGGTATNIVPALVEIKGEVRSHRQSELTDNLALIREKIADACLRWGGEYSFESETAYPAFVMREEMHVVKMMQQACLAERLEFCKTKSGGGSDANIFNAAGLEILNLGAGFQNIHSVSERLAVKDLEALYALALRLVSLYGKNL